MLIGGGGGSDDEPVVVEPVVVDPVENGGDGGELEPVVVDPVDVEPVVIGGAGGELEPVDPPVDEPPVVDVESEHGVQVEPAPSDAGAAIRANVPEPSIGAVAREVVVESVVGSNCQSPFVSSATYNWVFRGRAAADEDV